MIYGLDPGTLQSAIVAFDGRNIHFAQIMDNEALLALLRRSKSLSGQILAIESIASYGMPVGRETFETAEYCGRAREAAEAKGAIARKVYRRDVKIHLCGTAKAKDSNISQALRDKYGKDALKGIVSHLWAAMAVADYAYRCPTIIATDNKITATANNG